MFWQSGFWSNECTEHSTCTHIYRPPSGITHLELVQSTLTRFIIIPNADSLAFAWESGGESERNHQPRVFTNPGLERPSERRLINVVGEFLAGVRGFMSIVAASFIELGAYPKNRRERYDKYPPLFPLTHSCEHLSIRSMRSQPLCMAETGAAGR